MTGKGCVPVHDPSGRNATCDHATDAEENVQQEHATGEDNDIVYRKNEADPMRDALGSGRISDPDEWDSILQQLEDSGVEIKYRDRDMAYAPGLEEGDPGQIIIDPDAFLSALKHGYQHFLDAQTEGFPSLGKQLFPNQKQMDAIGDDPILYPCPCCRKKTLWKRGEYDICSCCGWEDDGFEEDDKYSSLDHMTLGQGRRNYLLSGGCLG